MSLKQKTIKLSIVTGITTFLGFLFHVLLGRKFGIAYQLDSFFIVLTLFAFLGLSNSFLTSLFIPIFNDVKKDDFADSIVFVDVIIKWVVLISLFIVSIVFLFNFSIIKLLASGFDEKSLALSVEINKIIMFSLIFSGIETVARFTLNALYHYFIPALLGLLRPIFNILAIFFLAPIFGIKGIAISYLASTVVISLILLMYLHFKTGWKFTLCFYHKKLPELFKKSSKMTFAMLIWSLKDVITRNVASRLGEGAVALFAYAEKIIAILIKVVIEPISRVFYAKVSELSASSKWSDIRNLFARVVKVNLSVSFFIAAGTITFLHPVLGRLFNGSKFTFDGIRTLSILCSIMLVWFIFESVQVYLSRIIFATKRAAVAMIVAAGGIFILFISISPLASVYGIYGITIAVVFAQVIVCLLYYLFTKNMLQISFFYLARIFLSRFVIAFVFGILGVLVCRFINNDLVVIFIVLPVWLFFYVLFAKLFMKEDMEVLLKK